MEHRILENEKKFQELKFDFELETQTKKLKEEKNTVLGMRKKKAVETNLKIAVSNRSIVPTPKSIDRKL